MINHFLKIKYIIMKQLLFICLLGLTCGFFSCGETEDLDIPECVADRLESFMSEACDDTQSTLPGNLARFRFRTEIVYCFNWGACQPNKTVEIWTEECGLLCELGGATGLTVCDGSDWGTNAEELAIIWQRDN
jgi:hypothetical protein